MTITVNETTNMSVHGALPKRYEPSAVGQHSTARHSTSHHSTAQHSTAQPKEMSAFSIGTPRHPFDMPSLDQQSPPTRVSSAKQVLAGAGRVGFDHVATKGGSDEQQCKDVASTECWQGVRQWPAVASSGQQWPAVASSGRGRIPSGRWHDVLYACPCQQVAPRCHGDVNLRLQSFGRSRRGWPES
jgi:hypothetical protein